MQLRYTWHRGRAPSIYNRCLHLIIIVVITLHLRAKSASRYGCCASGTEPPRATDSPRGRGRTWIAHIGLFTYLSCCGAWLVWSR